MKIVLAQYLEKRDYIILNVINTDSVQPETLRNFSTLCAPS